MVPKYKSTTSFGVEPITPSSVQNLEEKHSTASHCEMTHWFPNGYHNFSDWRVRLRKSKVPGKTQ